MKFGPVPVTEAAGAILAHSVKVSDQKLRKGLMLTIEHVSQLSSAGFDEVIVARLVTVMRTKPPRCWPALWSLIRQTPTCA